MRSADGFVLEQAIDLLRATPAALQAWLGGLAPQWCAARERPDTWNAREIVAHLIFGEQTDWLPRVRRILESGEDEPFEAFDRAGHAALARQPLPELLEEFERRRAESLEELEGLRLTAQDLERRGRHPALGAVTLRNLLATWTVHDLDHLAQIARIFAKRWRAAVGPWDHPDFLGVLHRRKPGESD
jgi:hypothetical protein